MRLRNLTSGSIAAPGARREILSVLAKYGLADWLSNVDYDWLRALLQDAEGEAIQAISTPERIRRALDRSRDQLSSRSARFSVRGRIWSDPEITAELANLQQNTRPDEL